MLGIYVVVRNCGIIAMNTSILLRIKCAIVFIVLMIFSISPISITSTIGLLVVIFRPLWFKKLIDKIYPTKTSYNAGFLCI